MAVLILAEKPSVARDIALAMGGSKKNSGSCWEAENYRIVSAVGHLVTLCEPHEINPTWKSWQAETLPMIPESWPLKVVKKTKKQFDNIKRQLLDPEITEIICATDAGREGEHIFRLIMEKAGCHKPFRRLWISSLTPEAIREGMRHLRDGREFDGLANGAKVRSQADWLAGMNLSRAYSLKSGEALSLGRVQTPTLQMVVRRELEIRDFRPEAYREVLAVFSLHERTFQAHLISEDEGDEPDQSSPGRGNRQNFPGRLKLEEDQYEGWYIENPLQNQKDKSGSLLKRRRLPDDKKATEVIIERLKSGQAKITRISEKQTEQHPPDLYDLTELQRRANRLYHFSARKTLEVAQSLYEKKKLISYPRTDCRYISEQEEKKLPDIVRGIRTPYALLLAEQTGGPLPDRRFIQNHQVTEHHAIIPTGQKAIALSEDEEKIYDLICRRFLSMWHQSSLMSAISCLTEVSSHHKEKAWCDYYQSEGKRLIRKGWKIMEEDLNPEQKKPDQSFRAAFREITEGQKVWPYSAKSRRTWTRPPPALSEAALLSGMESAGRNVTEKQLAEAMKGKGIGTPATRAGIIETLKKRGFIHSSGRALRASEKGIALIRQVHEDLKSPRLTGEWEAMLEKVTAGVLRPEDCMQKISHWTREQVRLALENGCKIPKEHIKQKLSEDIIQDSLSTESRESERPNSLHEVLHKTFGLDTFRPKQEEVCQALVDGHNCLLVMPTGAGKSLCYQLPALIRGGTALVISPLIALMEDQANALNQLGLQAACIHMGRDRLESREALQHYRSGNLKFLFVSPERLGVPGFIPWLEQHPPGLIAIDEAHCISQWGHDFRADYRLLKPRLRGLTQIPKVAMTATATPEVSKDIIRELELGACQVFSSGFRRTNIRIMTVEMIPQDRLAATMAYLEKPEHRPAIIYTATRMETERVAAVLQKLFRVRAYHAGLSTDIRNRAQAEFMKGTTEVVVATIAFGMGVNKANIRTVIHLSLPSGIENYYQEIGRAGRDGQMSTAILFYSSADYKTLTHFYQHNYPEPEELADFLRQIGSGCLPEATISFCRESQQQVYIQKLLVHGAIRLSATGELQPIPASKWKQSYIRQKEHKEESLKEIWSYPTQTKGCRMTALIRHFEPDNNKPEACGHCDLCDPQLNRFRRYRSPTGQESHILSKLWSCATKQNFWSRSSLFRQLNQQSSVKREHFDVLISSMLASGYLTEEWSEFNKGGRTIRYQKIRASSHKSLKKTSASAWNSLKIPEAGAFLQN